MNAGNTPGYLLKKINKALCSAFPGKDDLKMMLRYQFNINLEEVAGDKNLKTIVQELVDDFEHKNKLPKLLNKALKENPGNPELKAIKEKFEITTSLLNLLLPLENNLMKQMQKAYQACCTDDYLNYLEEDEMPESLYEILDILEDIPQQNDDEKLIVKFVARLLETESITNPHAEKLKQWLTKTNNNVPDLSNNVSDSDTDLLDELISYSPNHQQPNLDSQPYLLVKVDSSKQYYQQRQPNYLVSAWFIPDINNYDYERNNKRCKFLETPPADGESEQDVFSLEDLPKLIEFFLDQLIQYSREYYRQPILVFFLPYKLLNHELEKIQIQDDDDLQIPLGSEYCVIFRSVKRLKKYRHQGKWLNKWTQIQDNCETCLSNFAFINFEYWEELYTDLEERKAIAVKLNQPPCEQILKVIDRTAIPVALWLRKNNFETINCQNELEQLLNCKITELLEKVKQQRLQAFGKGNKQEHIGNHLALLWEDPYLLPPQIEYTTL
ncbi:MULTISPECIES: effector-associated domain EAD1-containing protein [unclassified Moorena]|uniref:VMAP-C domain-containing protein n=1 Tax=unclassified Moorena TaxID=2683338 RepID=UPI001400A234|nr:MULTISPECIES: effector-associated domain EAD1-containing protein [unclassified Moorena]NEO14316.1 hypothetical protein [Moorena sp. SIO3E8]NEQ00393.1 hypothetical protein [Moorena sp. SIO3F7]